MRSRSVSRAPASSIASSMKASCRTLSAFGKGLGGGLPVAAMVGPAAILDHATAFAMQTLHGNPIAMAAGNAVLETIDDEKLIDNAREVGAICVKGLEHLKSKHQSRWPIFAAAGWRSASN